MMYDYAKSMVVSQTLCENIGSTMNDTHTDKKASTLRDKIEKRTVSKLAYNKDSKRDVMVNKTKEMYKTEIGSHVLIDTKAKSKHKVLNKIMTQKHDSIFCLPLTIE